jgi:phosphatidylglycerol:prolipoprotein diacylglycerol transferase
MVSLGFLVGLWTASRRALLQGLPPEKILDLGPWVIVGAILGARLLYVISYWHESFAGHPLSEIFMVWHGGLVYYGGLMGAVFASIIYIRRRNLPMWRTGDVMAPSIALGHVFGRIGCLLNGCCYGKACSLPWAIVFPLEARGAPPGVKLHPTQIYESLLNLVLYLGLATLYRRKKFEGQVFATYLVGYAVIRSFVELFRGDYSANQYLGGWLSPGQVVSVIIMVIGVVLLWILSRGRSAPSETQDQATAKAHGGVSRSGS